MTYVIAFFDVGIELYCNEDKEGDRTSVMRFGTNNKAIEFLKTLDSREFDRFVLRLNEEQIKRYER